MLNKQQDIVPLRQQMFLAVIDCLSVRNANLLQIQSPQFLVTQFEDTQINPN